MVGQSQADVSQLFTFTYLTRQFGSTPGCCPARLQCRRASSGKAPSPITAVAAPLKFSLSSRGQHAVAVLRQAVAIKSCWARNFSATRAKSPDWPRVGRERSALAHVRQIEIVDSSNNAVQFAAKQFGGAGAAIKIARFAALPLRSACANIFCEHLPDWTDAGKSAPAPVRRTNVGQRA